MVKRFGWAQTASFLKSLYIINPRVLYGRIARDTATLVRKDLRKAAATVGRIDKGLLAAMLVFVASLLGFVYSNIYYSRLHIDITDYAVLADYPVFAIKGAFVILLMLSAAPVTYLATLPLRLGKGYPRRLTAVRRLSRWRERAGKPPVPLIERLHRGILYRQNSRAGRSLFPVTVFTSVLFAGIALFATDLQGQVLAVSDPDKPNGGLRYIIPVPRPLPVCVRMERGYLGPQDAALTPDCQHRAYLVGVTSNWMIFRVSGAVRVLPKASVLEVSRRFSRIRLSGPRPLVWTPFSGPLR